MFQPFSGFADHLPVKEGKIAVDPEMVGVGFEANSSLFAIMSSIDV